MQTLLKKYNKRIFRQNRCSRDFFPFLCAAQRFLQTFYRSTVSRELKLSAFLQNLHMRTSSIKFFHVPLRSLLRRMQRRVVAAALYSLSDRTAIIEFQRLKFSGKIVVQMKENNTADMPSAGHIANCQNLAANY